MEAQPADEGRACGVDQDFTDLDLFSEIVKVEASLGGNSMDEETGPGSRVPQRTCALALAWCSENKAALRKIRVRSLLLLLLLRALARSYLSSCKAGPLTESFPRTTVNARV